jgi:putative aldouronate transport system permease protein
MVQENNYITRFFVVLNYTFLITLSLLCVLPLVHVLAVSLSSEVEVSTGAVKFWPRELTFDSYQFILRYDSFSNAVWVSVQRVLLGVSINMILTILLAYPLSKEAKVFPYRTLYVWLVVFTMLFHGGLVPLFMTVKYTGIMDTLWALVLPSAVPVFNVVLLLNFFRSIPKELEEAAFIDGAGFMTSLTRIFLPLSKPALATITLFACVNHWNAWFDGMIFINTKENIPLQTYLQTLVINLDLTQVTTDESLREMENMSERTFKSAQIFLGALPILMIYPFLQKYFTKGIVLGSVKE